MVALLFAGLLAARGTSASSEPAAGAVDGGTPARANAALLALCCAVLVGAFFAELAVVGTAALTQVPLPDWYAQLPILPIDENPPLYGHTPPWVGNELLALAALQSVALYGLYRVLRRNTLGGAGLALLGVSSAAMLFGALSTRGTAATFDLYLNVGYAQLGLGAYAPPDRPFAGEFGAINRLWGTPILPAAYGPLWLLIASAVARAVHGLAAQLQAFRVLGAAAFLICLALLRFARLSPAALALCALNPVLIFQYVVDAHNDIFPLAFALLAIVAARRQPWLALACVAAAGAMKLPFAVAAALAFARLDERRSRVGFAAGGIALALLATELGSGGAYLAAVSHALAYQHLSNPLDRLAHALAIGAALVAFSLAIWGRRFIPTASWTFLSFGAVVLPWYAVWGLPYAILERTFLPVYLITLPLVAFDLATSFGLTPAARILFLLVICSPIVFLVRQRRLAAA